MKYKALIVLFLTLIVSVLLLSDFGKQPKVYNCDIAEWHPDVPVDVKEECRRLRKEHFNNQHRKMYI
jgi:hypothetical protein